MKNISYNLIAKGLTALLIVAIIVPATILARPFASDTELKVYPANEVVTFSPLKIGDIATQYITVENTSYENKTLNINTFNVYSPFIVASASTIIIPSHTTTSIPVSFSPTTEGHFKTHFTIAHSQTGETKTISLEGQAISANQDKGLKISKSTMQFPNTLVGEIADGSFTITNNNTVPVTLNYNFANDKRTPFKSNNRTVTVFPGETTYVTLSFIPTDDGKFTHSFKITENSTLGEKLHFVKLQATALAPLTSQRPELEISHTSNSIDFGNLSKGETGSKSITFTNNGTRTITVNVQQYPNEPFSVKMPATLEIPSNSQKVVRVLYTPYPESLSTSNSSITFVTNASNISSKTYSLTGTHTNYQNTQATSGKKVNRADLQAFLDGISVDRKTINPDKGERLNFKFRSPLPAHSEFTIDVTDLRTETTVYKATYTNSNPSASWDGRRWQGYTVSAGEYVYSVKTTAGTIYGKFNVVRNSNHTPENFYVRPQNNQVPTLPVLPTTPRKQPSNKVTNIYTNYFNTDPNQLIIQDLVAAPRIVTLPNASVYLSFHNLQTVSLTANILDANKRHVKNIVKNMPASYGLKLNHISWNTLLNGELAPNGLYYFELSSVYQNEVERHVVPFTIDRDPNYQLYLMELETQTQEFYTPYMLNKTPQAPKKIEDNTTKETAACLDYTDIEAQTELCKAVELIVLNNLIHVDFDDETIRLEDFITRAEALSVVSNLVEQKLPTYSSKKDGLFGFKDLKPSEWYMPYYKNILKLRMTTPALGYLTMSYKDNTIRPTQPATREEVYPSIFAAIQNSKYIKSNLKTGKLNDNTYFHDVTTKLQPYSAVIALNLNDTDFAKKYFETYNLQNPQTKFQPKEAVSRQEVFELIYTLVQKDLIELK